MPLAVVKPPSHVPVRLGIPGSAYAHGASRVASAAKLHSTAMHVARVTAINPVFHLLRFALRLTRTGLVASVSSVAGLRVTISLLRGGTTSGMLLYCRQHSWAACASPC